MAFFFDLAKKAAIVSAAFSFFQNPCFSPHPPQSGGFLLNHLKKDSPSFSRDAPLFPPPIRLTAISKRFRRQLLDSRFVLNHLLSNYLHLSLKSLNIDSLFIVDLSAVQKPLYVVAYHTKGYDEQLILLTA